jgi:hypothetical protein
VATGLVGQKKDAAMTVDGGLSLPGFLPVEGSDSINDEQVRRRVDRREREEEGVRLRKAQRQTTGAEVPRRVLSGGGVALCNLCQPRG